jgi:hypothetical protein
VYAQTCILISVLFRDVVNREQTVNTAVTDEQRMSVTHRKTDNDSEITSIQRRNPFQCQFVPPKLSLGPAWDRTRVSAATVMETVCLNHVITFKVRTKCSTNTNIPSRHSSCHRHRTAHTKRPLLQRRTYPAWEDQIRQRNAKHTRNFG